MKSASSQMTNRNGSPWSASQALAWIICQKPLKLEERQWTEDMSPNLEQAQQKLAAAIGSGEVQAWGRREPHPMLEQIPRDPFCYPGRPVIVAPLGDMRALLPHKYQYDGPRWHVTEFDAAQIKRVFPKSPLAAAREWMLKNASKDQKRYSLLQECMKATGCKRREAEAIYKELPDELRSPRGRPIRNSEQPPAAAPSTADAVDASGEQTCSSPVAPPPGTAVNASDDERSETPSQS